MMLSKNLSLRECTKSATAIRHDIDNNPGIQTVMRLKNIAQDVFQPIRDHFNVPIGISSGYRSKALNKAVRGSRNSQHITGCALDIDADIYGQITNKQIFDFVKENLVFDQLIWEFGGDENPAWVHVSYDKDKVNRGEVLLASIINGRVRYTPIT